MDDFSDFYFPIKKNEASDNNLGALGNISYKYRTDGRINQYEEILESNIYL